MQIKERIGKWLMEKEDKSESSTADITNHRDFMNKAIMAEDEVALNGDSDDDLPEDDNIPDLV